MESAKREMTAPVPTIAWRNTLFFPSWGSSIAYGHPFGATGARMLSHAIAFLHHHNKRRALVAACTAGGLAGACLLSTT